MTANAGIILAPQGAGEAVPVRGLRLDRVLSHPVGRADILLPATAAAPLPGARMTLTMRSGDKETLLMTGDVVRVVASPRGARVSLMDPAAALTETGPAKAFSASTAGQIIADLCGAADVPTGTIMPGITVPHVVLGSGASRLDHCLRLARLSGLALFTAPDGALGSVALGLPVPTGAPGVLSAALDTRDMTDMAEPGKARVTGAGALGAAGPGMTTLPLADAGPMQAGSAEAEGQVRAAALRVLSDVMALQLAEEQRRGATTSGLSVTTPMPEDLRPGDVVTLPDANGLPIRIARLERLAVRLGGGTGLRADYAFSDVRAA